MRLKTSVLALALVALPVAAWAGLVPGAPAAGAELPEPIRAIAAWGFGLQRQLTGEIRAGLATMKETGDWTAAGGIILASFLYGVFHAVGPGHGKVVIAGWFASRRERIVTGLMASLIAAMVQAGSAIVMVGVLAGLLALAPRDVNAGAAWLEVASYALILVIGAVTLRRTWRDEGCGHDHGHHHHHEHGACCAHGHDHDHHHHPAEPERRANLFAMAAAVGFRPCSGAILVLLFTFANSMILVGMLSTIAMGLGVAITVAAIGLGALGLNRLIEHGFGGTALGGKVRKGLALAGALAITLLGAVLLLGALVNGPSLGA
jgi:ABC-type nickel/cobalt efflux system permease component RcnA